MPSRALALQPIRMQRAKIAMNAIPVAWIIIVSAMSDRPQVQFSMSPRLTPGKDPAQAGYQKFTTMNDRLGIKVT